MERFIRRKNIERYRKLLAETTDAAQRRKLEKLLAEEEGRGAGLQPPAGADE